MYGNPIAPSFYSISPWIYYAADITEQLNNCADQLSLQRFLTADTYILGS